MFGLCTVIFGGVVVLCVALVDSESSWLIMPLIAVALVVAIGAMVAVFRRAGTDPAGLLLTHVTGPEYESIRRLTLGDSSAGEHVAMLATARPVGGTSLLEETVPEDAPSFTAGAESEEEETL
jgi:hypothetical protein